MIAQCTLISSYIGKNNKSLNVFNSIKFQLCSPRTPIVISQNLVHCVNLCVWLAGALCLDVGLNAAEE